MALEQALPWYVHIQKATSIEKMIISSSEEEEEDENEKY